MKLLFDENLSPRLPALLAKIFPQSTHVRDCGLKGGDDAEIWEYAQQNGYIIVSKDSDFYEKSLLSEARPQLIWLRIGNCTRTELAQMLRENEAEIRSFSAEPEESVLILAAKR